MASTEGAKRLKRLGVGIAVWGALIAFLLWCADLYMNKVGYGVVVLMVGFPVVFGGIIWVVGWLLEGFLSPSANRP